MYLLLPWKAVYRREMRFRFIKIGNAKGRTVHSYSELAMYMELHKEEVQEGEVSLTVLRDGEKLSFSVPCL